MASSMAAAVAAAAASSRSTPALAPVTLTDLLRSNDKTVWKLKLHNPPNAHFEDFSEFCRALSGNVTVTTVHISWGFLRHLLPASRIVLLETIGRLPQLEDLGIQVLGTSFVQVLTAALKHATKLRNLRIGRMRLSSNQNVVELADALRGCLKLEQISLSSFHVTVEGMDNANADEGWLQGNNNNEETKKITVDPLLEAIVSLPVLAHIRLQIHLNGSKTQEAPRDHSLRSLCHYPRRSLIFNSCGLSDKQCETIADELKPNNKTVSSSSSTLSILVVTRNYEISPRGWDAFVDMLGVNHQIVDFHPGDEGQSNAPTPEQLKIINYYLGLNQAGRGNLLRGSMTARRKAWMDFLISGRNELDFVFYALLVDPTLYVVAQGEGV